jgi:lipoyl(octanoyl) transferase
MNTINCLDLGRIGYQRAWHLQTQLHSLLVKRKRGLLDGESNVLDSRDQHILLVCEHDPVFTLGKSGSENNLLESRETLADKGFEYFKINRGGDITYHGPGQVVVYPILDLDCFFTDVHKYVRFLEETIIRTLADYGIVANREKGFTGVWVSFDEPPFNRKICAIGVHLSRWVTMHGLAFNLKTDLSHFNYIIPCGINDQDRDVCSLEQILGYSVDRESFTQKFLTHFGDLFEAEMSFEKQDQIQDLLRKMDMETD